MSRAGGWLIVTVVAALASCAAPGPQQVVDPLQKITFNLDVLNDEGLRGPPRGLTAVAYEFCIPATKRHEAEVSAIDPSVGFMRGSPGRVGCGDDQVLCIGSTHQASYRNILLELAGLSYIDRIDECFFE